ncbi:uncharacterized protein N7506_004499 [Penicillium brevicompactum]|uniref:uncharacterized protein n=1 Tax=Penicillium brevicompactum TaxID=5074 RepID=UPI0025420034|nr:uncharacterized protein N7506_004499 [Penicillium brevicompactum]KAJ5336477.1 hypothetical protein N7506_004499 [Penicillium brevicompactum]
MSFDIVGDDDVLDYKGVDDSTYGQRIRLFLVLAAIGSSLAAYVEGTVVFAFRATLTPREPRRLFSPQNFRYLPIMLLHQALKMFLISLFPTSGSSLVKCFLLSVIFESVLSPLKVANIQSILNLHPQVSLRRRTLNQSVWFDIFPATLLHSTASSFCFYITVYAIRTLGFVEGEFTSVARKTALYMVFSLYGVTYVGGTVPTYAVFMRVAASVNPTHDSQNHATGTIDIKGAWRSLSWSTLTMLLANMYFVAVLKYVAVMCMALFSIIHFVDHSSGYSGFRDAGFFFAKYYG